MHAALEAALKRPLAAPARVNLRLHDSGLAKFHRDFFRLLRSVGDAPRLGGDSKFSEKFAGLVLVDVHRLKSGAQLVGGAAAKGKQCTLDDLKTAAIPVGWR